MPPVHAAMATPSQKLAAAAHRERERRMAVQPRTGEAIEAQPASEPERPAGGGRLRHPAVPKVPPKRIRPPVRIWFRIIGEIRPSLSPKLSIEAIQSAVEHHCKVGHLELISARRDAPVVRARQIAMFLAKLLTPYSLPVIGGKFGGRDHSTVIHAVRKIEQMRTRNTELARDLDAIRRAITAQMLGTEPDPGR